MGDRNLKEHEIIKVRAPKLITAICDCVSDVSDHCLAKGLITGDTYDKMLSPGKLSADKARILLHALRRAIEIKSDCFETFLHVLNETLPCTTKETVIADLKDLKASNDHRRHMSRRQTVKSKPPSAASNHHPRYDLVLVRFTGPLATKKFQKLDRAFCKALSTCNTKSVMSATKKILSMNVSMDYKCISLVHRANSKAPWHYKGQEDKALLDCDRAIKLASNLECENGSLIIGRALIMKTSILRWSKRLDEAMGCVDRAKRQFFLAAPSSDTASLLYEEVRMKICIAISEGKDINVYISHVQNDYDRIFKHSLCLDVYDRSRLCAFINAQAEVYLRTYYLDNKLPFSAIPVPTDSDLRRAEEILNLYDELPKKSYGNRGWHYQNRGDLCMWRKQYSEAIEWAKKAQNQFTRANMKHITNPEERVELYQRLQWQLFIYQKRIIRYTVKRACALIRILTA